MTKNNRFWHSLVFRLVAMMLLTTVLGIVIVAIIIHQTTQSNFDAQLINWQVMHQQDPSEMQSQVQTRYSQSGMQGACEYVAGIDSAELTTDIVLLDNSQMVHCATKPFFRYAQVVFHDSGTIRLFSESANVMAFDLEVSESLPLRNAVREIEGWAMTVEAQPLMMEGNEFAWHVWQQSSIWIVFTLSVLALIVAFSVSRAMLPVYRITDAAGQLKSGKIPAPLESNANATELTALIETFNQATKTLSETQKMREELVSDIAHELRTPVTNIKGQLEALQMRLVSNNDEFHNTVSDEVLLLQQLIADFQELARSDAGKLSLNPASYPVSELLESCLLSQKQTGKLRIDITLEDELFVEVDELRFRQVILNLTENAKHAKPEDLHIQVTVETVGQNIVIHFIDDGPGVAAEDIPHIFERFYRADKSRSRKTGGSGLGLAIVRGMVSAMQGSIEYQDRENCGGYFVITLPKGQVPDYSDCQTQELS